jgi:hypothetical protein
LHELLEETQMRLNMTSLAVGLAASTVLLGTLVSSPADAQSRKQQRVRADQWHNENSAPRYTPREYVVCYTGCGRRNSIVLGADPDPNIRSQLQRDHGYFGGID